MDLLNTFVKQQPIIRIYVRRNVLFYWIPIITLIILLMGGFAMEVFAQTSDFFSNTQTNGSTSSPGCPNCPGFDPSAILQHIDPATCPVTPCIAPFFNQTGPGAVTDNMFAIVSTDADTSICGRVLGTLLNGLPGLNCGDIRVDPVSQSMTIPSGANSILSETTSVPAQDDVCALAGPCPSDDAHMGYQNINTFTFAPCSPGTSPACTMGAQTERQVVALVSGGAGTLSSPGTGDQFTLFTTSWSTNNSDASTFDNPVINWTLEITSPEAFSGQGVFSQDNSGTFTFDPTRPDPSDGGFPVTTYPSGPQGTSLTLP